MSSTPAQSRVLRANSPLDFLIAGAVIAVALGFLVFLQIRTGTGRLTNYDITVEMADAGGLKLGSDVRLGGVKVGTVTGLTLNPKSYLALVRMDLRDDMLLPADSFFSVSAPVMNDSYLSVLPGHSAVNIRPGSVLRLPRKLPPRNAGV
jgi:phospholipid/cholesterol/gamma-HCH transport system substrate-binding protein